MQVKKLETKGISLVNLEGACSWSLGLYNLLLRPKC